MKQVYLDTFGCQMNVADTDRMELLLFHSGYFRTHEAENADLIIVNTCSIREKAENKIYSLFGHFRPMKARNPKLILGMAGCLAQQEGENILKKAPFIDFIMGPDCVEQISDVVQHAQTTRKPRVWTEFDREKEYSIPDLEHPEDRPADPSSFINIIKGCDKFCSFCVVPFTRGREKSREAAEIVAEAEQLVRRGAREIILLGQNVNAYGKRGLIEPTEFHELLYRVAEVPGLQRLRFTTSHPKDFTPELVQAYQDLDVLVNHLHLPVQSGNDRILEEMRRGHTVAEYRALIDLVRNKVPDMSFSTDVIIGYPSETEREFEDTLDLMEWVGYSSSFMFQYSPRPNTPAAEIPDTVSELEKRERLQRTIELQNRLTLEQGQRFIGTEVEALVEGPASRSEGLMRGRSPHYWSVFFPDPLKQVRPGERVSVLVEDVRGHSLSGSVNLPAAVV